MELITKFIKAGNGDAILITYKEPVEEKFQHILIDGGGKLAYENNLKVELIKIVKAGECLDLLIITHIDQDHIGGIIKLFDDLKENKLAIEIKEIWFNTNSLLKEKEFWLSSQSTKISINQGADLQLYVNKKAEYVNAFIARPQKYENNSGVAYFANRKVKITVLSPTESYLTEYNKKIENEWNDKIKKHLNYKHSDYKISGNLQKYNGMRLSELIPIVEKQRLEDKEEEDNSPSNMSSISFIFECDKMSILLLGDAPHQIVTNSLIDLGYTKLNPIKVDYVKLAHHGGAANTSYELLELIECKNYIISGDGKNTNKSTIAKIISEKRDNVNFYFNYPAESYPFSFYDTIMKINELDKYSCQSIFTKLKDTFLTINYDRNR